MFDLVYFQSDTLTFYSTYSATDLQPIVKQMCRLVLKSGSGKLSAIKTKYESSKFMRISKLPQLKSQTVTDLAEL